jgi:hypothetical protein
LFWYYVDYILLLHSESKIFSWTFFKYSWNLCDINSFFDPHLFFCKITVTAYQLWNLFGCNKSFFFVILFQNFSKSIFHFISLSNKISGFTELSILLNYSNLDFVNLLTLNFMHLIVVEFNLSGFLGILKLFVFHIFIPAWSRGEHRVDSIVSEGLLTF